VLPKRVVVKPLLPLLTPCLLLRTLSEVSAAQTDTV
jgi:hypothetical protein